MSAFVVSKEHIDALVAVALHGPKDRDNGSQWNWGGHAFSWDCPSIPSPDWGGDPDEYRAAVMERRRELVRYPGMHARNGQAVTPDELGDMLTRENVRSVMHRYPDTLDGGSVPGPLDEFWAAPYAYNDRTARRLTCVEALKAISCLEYQSCEHDEWEASEARAVLEVLKDMISSSLPGYDAAPWSL